MSTPAAVVLQLFQFYGHGADPDRRNIALVFGERPYDQLLPMLQRVGSVVDTTDINEDVSFAWAIEIGGDTWLIRLSMVGPYALVTDPVGSPVEGPSGTPIDAVLRILDDEGFKLTNRTFNERPVQLWAFGEGLENCFQCLFQMGAEPPWQLI